MEILELKNTAIEIKTQSMCSKRKKGQRKESENGKNNRNYSIRQIENILKKRKSEQSLRDL